MTFGFGQFSKLRKTKLSDNTRFLGNSISPFVPTIGGGSTTASPGNGYTYTTFTGSGTLTISTPQTVDIFVVGGGGAGGTRISVPNSIQAAGGGGGGGVVFVPNITLSTGEYVVIVGAGAGDSFTSTGNDSIVSTSAGTSLVRAKGGGTGGSPIPLSSNIGGSGGGASAVITSIGSASTQSSTPQPGISTYTSFGNTGGPSNGSAGGGGGGGAGGPGGFPQPPSGSINIYYGGGPGGAALNTGSTIPSPSFAGPLIGISSLTPLAGFYAGGGGGGGAYGGNGGNANGGGGGGGCGAFWPSYGTGGLGGSSPGGNPGQSLFPVPAGILNETSRGGDGWTNSGGGGGGQGYGTGSTGITTAATGGSGIVIVRYFSGP